MVLIGLFVTAERRVCTPTPERGSDQVTFFQQLSEQGLVDEQEN